MDISVIICTYNRCASLRRTLQTCCDLVIPDGVTWELLVVDNNSTDATKQICEEFTGKLPIRYLFESRQGKSCALNRGVRESEASLLAFTDDDVDVDKNWLAALYDASNRYPQAGFFGGKIIPRWEVPPPRWLAQHERSLLRGVAICYDVGEAERTIEEFQGTEVLPFLGANLAIRKCVFSQEVRFREDIGPTGTSPVRGEETDLLVALTQQGCKGVHVPSAVVHHRNPAHRTTEKYVREWFKGSGMGAVRLGEVRLDTGWFGVPRYVWRQLVESALKYVCARWTRPSAVWLPAEIKMATAWGVITEARRQMRLGTPCQNRSNE